MTDSGPQFWIDQDGETTKLPQPPNKRILEVKEQLNGVVRQFELECWLNHRDLIVGRWVAGNANPYGLPSDLVSWGVWWRLRPYGIYRIHHADGQLYGYRADVLDRVEISTEGVRYRDLLLDAWVTPDRKVFLEDEDEVAVASLSGQLSSRDQRRIARARLLLTQGWDRIETRVDSAIESAISAIADKTHRD
jgi:hypothetical protein